MIKAVIFDFDGTLADTRHIVYKAYERLVEKHGFKKFSPEELKAMKSLSVKERFKRSGVPLFKLPQLVREAQAVYGEFIDLAVPYKDIPELLQTLKKKGLRLYVISSNSVANINIFLAAHSLELFVQVYSSSGLFGKHRTINRLIENLGIQKKEAVYVGDEVRDIIACKKASVPIIAVTWGYDELHLLQESRPDFVVGSPSEILGLTAGA